MFCCLSVTGYFKRKKQPKKHKRKKRLFCCPSVTGCSKGKKNNRILGFCQPLCCSRPSRVASTINGEKTCINKAATAASTQRRERGWQYTQTYPCTPHANKYEHAHSLSESRKEKGESQNNGRDASKLALPSMNMNQPMASLSFLLA